jgi:integrase
MKFTERYLRSVKIPTKMTEISDDTGLLIRIQPTGTISFLFRYSWNKKQQRIFYGKYGKISLAEARDKLAADKKLLAEGINPNEQKVVTIKKRIETPTLNELTEQYYQQYLLRNLRRPEYPYGLLKRYILPELGTIRVIDLTQIIITEQLEKIAATGAKATANRALSVFKSMLEWCVARGYIAFNPIGSVKKKAIGGKENYITRFLTFDEIELFIQSMETAKISTTVDHVIRLLLLTGQRVGEICNAEWKEFDLENHIWIIPAEKTKTSEQQRVWLTKRSLELLKDLKYLAGKSPYVVQSPHFTKKHCPVDYRAIARAVKRIVSGMDIPSFTPHDLRRTVATQMAELGIAPHIVEKVLNHKLQGIMAVYNQAEYWEEKKAAWEKWALQLAEIV